MAEQRLTPIPGRGPPKLPANSSQLPVLVESWWLGHGLPFGEKSIVENEIVS